MKRSLRLVAILPITALALPLLACSSRAGDSASMAALLRPDSADLARQAPDSYRVRFETSRGPFVVQVVRAWAPHGADRFHYLVRHGFYDGARFFRVMPNFVAQFGLHGDPAVNDAWQNRTIPDDSVRQSNQPGFLTFATSGPNTRTTQLFINRADNRRLDALGFAPIGRIVDGQAAADSLYSGYGDGPPRGRGPEQAIIRREGNAYLARSFPLLDSIVRARVTQD